MAMVTVRGVGLAERRVVQILLEDIVQADRNTAMMVKRIRRQFDLRGWKREYDEILENETQRLAEAGELGEGQRVRSVGWYFLLEAGYYQEEEGEEETYGRDYRVDRTTLEWLRNLRNEREVWAWGAADEEGEERVAVALPSEMLEAIATLDEAIEEALAEKKEEE